MFDLPVVSSWIEAFFSEHTGPDVEALDAVPVELKLLASLQLFSVVWQDEERVSRHRIQWYVLWNEGILHFTDHLKVAVLKTQQCLF